MIYINQVLQSVKDSKRIRIVEIKESYVYIVNVDAITSMPKKELFTSFLTDVEQREWIIITDPFARVIEDEDLTDIQIQKRDLDWGIVQKYCLKHMNDLFQKSSRERKIKEIAQELDVTPTKVKKLLSRYWQRGMNKNAMLPDYAKSGGRGKTKKLSNDKVGPSA